MSAAIESVQAADMLLPGSQLRVRGPGLDLFDDDAVLSLEGTAVELPLVAHDGSELWFTLAPNAASALGVGEWSGEVLVRDDTRTTAPFAVALTVAQSLPVALTGYGDARVHRNDAWLVSGDGILAPGEGTNAARFAGTYTPQGDAPIQIDVLLPVVAAESFARDRGACTITTALGGLTAGAFVGQLTLETTTAAGEWSTSPPLSCELELAPPEVYVVSPSAMQLGQIVEVRGAGFIGGGESSSELTLLQLEGLYTEWGTEESSKVEAAIVPSVESGEVATFVLRAEVSAELSRLVSAVFGKRSGTFDGTIRAITSNGVEELASEYAPVTWDVLTTGQVVYLKFLPGFDQSLPLFGLGALAPEVKAGIAQSIERIYADYALDVRLEPPLDIDVNHHSVVEVGGADPNGIGLFGFDNTPGKDVGNLRLFDAIGGGNAQTQADGFPGYGGVFVEAFLYFSAHPPFDGPRPATAPTAEPLFDLIFDPVRDAPATLAELTGDGAAERVEAVQGAVVALGRLVGETTAHEIGHSLGLANPYGSANAYHNATDGQGCLMDEGNDRPFDERVGAPGATEVHFCHDHPEYLLDVLGPRPASPNP